MSERNKTSRPRPGKSDSAREQAQTVPSRGRQDSSTYEAPQERSTGIEEQIDTADPALRPRDETSWLKVTSTFWAEHKALLTAIGAILVTLGYFVQRVERIDTRVESISTEMKDLKDKTQHLQKEVQQIGITSARQEGKIDTIEYRVRRLESDIERQKQQK